jgi:hypothetical protein
MNVRQPLLGKLLERFEDLIAEGERILKTAKAIPAEVAYNELTGRHYQRRSGYQELDWPQFVEWRTKAVTLLSHVLPTDHVHFPAVKTMPNLQCTEEKLEAGISMLKGVKDDLEKGFLDNIFSRIEAEIASDYMGQAEQLLSEGHSGKFDHVPAAVLAGAVLEKGLRTLCARQQPAIPVVTSKGESKTLNPLIDDLKKAGVFNELKAKQLRAWADIRNKAAHGEFDQFKRSDVEQMIQGVTNFLADSLG